MFESVYLRAFKCFDELDLPLTPLTLLTGFNAAGKSTALQAVLLLAQSMRLRRLPSFVPLNGDLVQLGTFGEILSEHASGRDRSISIGVSGAAGALRWRLRADERLAGSGMRVEHLEFAPASSAGDLVVADVDQLPPEAESLLRALSEVVYVGPVRSHRTETFPSHDVPNPVTADVGIRGELAPWWLERHEADVPAERRCPGEPAPTLRRQVDAWLGTLFPGAETNAVRVDGTSLVRLELRTTTVDRYRRPANIGYGLGYAFPIVVALLLAERGQTVVLDSPEAHLHPSGQSAMGRMLASFAAAGVQILVETHSDHVLSGARRAVRDGVVPAAAVSAVFFAPRNRTKDGTQTTRLAFDARGNLSGWPEGFFDQAETDLASLAGWD